MPKVTLMGMRLVSLPKVILMGCPKANPMGCLTGMRSECLHLGCLTDCRKGMRWAFPRWAIRWGYRLATSMACLLKDFRWGYHLAIHSACLPKVILKAMPMVFLLTVIQKENQTDLRWAFPRLEIPKGCRLAIRWVNPMVIPMVSLQMANQKAMLKVMPTAYLPTATRLDFLTVKPTAYLLTVIQTVIPKVTRLACLHWVTLKGWHSAMPMAYLLTVNPMDFQKVMPMVFLLTVNQKDCPKENQKGYHWAMLTVFPRLVTRWGWHLGMRMVNPTVSLPKVILMGYHLELPHRLVMPTGMPTACLPMDFLTGCPMGWHLVILKAMPMDCRLDCLKVTHLVSLLTVTRLDCLKGMRMVTPMVICLAFPHLENPKGWLKVCLLKENQTGCHLAMLTVCLHLVIRTANLTDFCLVSLLMVNQKVMRLGSRWGWHSVNVTVFLQMVIRLAKLMANQKDCPTGWLMGCDSACLRWVILMGFQKDCDLACLLMGCLKEMLKAMPMVILTVFLRWGCQMETHLGWHLVKPMVIAMACLHWGLRMEIQKDFQMGNRLGCHLVFLQTANLKDCQMGLRLAMLMVILMVFLQKDCRWAWLKVKPTASQKATSMGMQMGWRLASPHSGCRLVMPTVKPMEFLQMDFHLVMPTVKPMASQKENLMDSRSEILKVNRWAYPPKAIRSEMPMEILKEKLMVIQKDFRSEIPKVKLMEIPKAIRSEIQKEMRSEFPPKVNRWGLPMEILKGMHSEFPHQSR